MFLKQLLIKNNNTHTVIREINFKMGINLIVDTTISTTKRESGNGVGKTTVLRLIDYCLGGDGKNIHNDSEFKKPNQKIFDFLRDEKVSICLILSANLVDPKAESIRIERNFLLRNEKKQEINGRNIVDEKEFHLELKNLIFGTLEEKPSFRNCIAKNVRDAKYKIDNTLKILYPMTKNQTAAYESLYFFLLGLDIDDSKGKLQSDLRGEKDLRTRLSRQYGQLETIEQRLLTLENRITKLTEEKNNYAMASLYEEKISELNAIQESIAIYSEQVSRLDMRHKLILQSKAELENSLVTIDEEEVRAIYERAKVLIPTLQKSFEDTIKFHNGMINERLEFIIKDLPQLERNLHENRAKLDEFIQKEKQIGAEVKKDLSAAEYEKLIEDLNKYHEEKGRAIEQKNAWITSNENYTRLTEQLDAIEGGNKAKNDLLQKQIADFNKYFSATSKELDGKELILSAPYKKDEGYKFEITNIMNPGKGEKTNEMIAFDLAYIQFADAKNIPCLHFILLDQIENVHANQITNLFTQIVNKVNCQYILPVLSDKLPKDVDTTSMKILELSQNDKLFKI